jgi:DNA polymerase-3 subunit beta
MKITFGTKDLRAALRVGSGLVSSKPALPVLGCVSISAGHESARLMTTSLDITHTVHVGLAQKSGGGDPVLVSHRDLSRVASGASGQTITIELKRKDSKRLTITSGAAKSTLPITPRDQAPQIPTVEGEASASIPAAHLGAVLDSVSHAMSRDESRLSFMGVQALFSGEHFSAAATDAHRLGFDSTQPEVIEGRAAVIPIGAVSMLRKLGAGVIHLAHDANYLRAWTEDHEIIAALLPGRWPDYSKAIPSRDQYDWIAVPVAHLSSALRRAADFAPDTGQVRLIVESGKITLTAECEKGQHSEPLECDGGKGCDVGLNAQYVIDAIKTARGDVVRIGIHSGEPEQFPMQILSDERPHMFQIVMPMQF